MWLYFDRNGALLRQLEHGDPARAGTTDFEIFAVFEGINDTATMPEAFLSLVKPDMDEEMYYELPIGKEKQTFIKETHEGDISPFVDGKEYAVYHFDFAYEDTGEIRNDVFLDTCGLWKAIITLMKNDDEIDVQGKVTFNVQGGIEDEDGNTFTPEEWMLQAMRHLASKMDKRGSGTIRFVPDITTLDHTATNVYQSGDIILDYKAHKDFYEIISLDPFDYKKLNLIGAGGGGESYEFLSLARLDAYLYEITFDTIPNYIEPSQEDPIITGCTSFVRDGKLYRNLDWNYDNTAEFHVICKNFEGIGFISGITDGNVIDEKKKLEQLPYHLVDGRNNDGIRVSTHILFNDWQYDGEGRKDISITTLPFHILNELHSMNDVHTVLDSYLANLKIPAALKAMGYLIQYLITDGTTTYAILPPNVVGGSYSLVNISSNPKLTNFRWVNRATVSHSDSDIQLHPTGVERWNSVNNNTVLSDLRFTKAYEEPTRLSEFIGLRNTDKNSSDAVLTEIYNTAHALYQERTRDGELWQTVHSVVYGAKRIEHLWVQEDYEKDFAVSGGDDSNKYIKKQSDSQQTIEVTEGASDTPLMLKGRSTSSYLGFKDKDGTILGYLGVNANKRPVFYSNKDEVLATKEQMDAFAKSLTMNSATYVLDLKDANGNILSSIDLPLETMVVSGSYNATTKKIILTLKNGQTIEIPIADVITGLANLSGDNTFTGTNSFAGHGLQVSGRVLGSGDDEGVVIAPAANGYAGVCLGSPSGERVVLYNRTTDHAALIRHHNGTAQTDLILPNENGTLATKEYVDNGLNDKLSKTSPELTSMGSTNKSVVAKEYVDNKDYLKTQSGGGASSISLKEWVGTQAQFDSITTKNSDTRYTIIGD